MVLWRIGLDASGRCHVTVNYADARGDATGDVGAISTRHIIAAALSDGERKGHARRCGRGLDGYELNLFAAKPDRAAALAAEGYLVEAIPGMGAGASPRGRYRASM